MRQGAGPLESSGVDELRRLLFEPEIRSLQSLEDTLFDPAQRIDRLGDDLSKLLARLPAGERERLARHLRPVVEETLAIAARDQPEALGELLAPALWPTLRCYVRQLLTGMVERLAAVVENAVTLRSLQWRWEAWRTGRSLGEIALLRSLRFRIDRVLLIHEPSGLLVASASSSADEAIDPDLISGMLTAFRDFMRASTSADLDAPAELGAIQSDQHTFVVHSCGDLVLAARVEGTVVPEVRDTLQARVELLHRRFAAELARFRGDVAPFEAARPVLEHCLELRPKPGQPGALSVGLRWATALVFVAVALGLVGWFSLDLWSRATLDAYRRALEARPGFIVTRGTARGLEAHLVGIRDPQAEAADDVWDRLREAEWWVRRRPRESWTEVVMADPILAERRLRSMLPPPVDVRVAGGIATIDGEVPLEDRRRVGRIPAELLGLKEVRWTRPERVPAAPVQPNRLIDALEQTSVPFLVGTTDLARPARWEAIIESLRRLDRETPTPLRVRVVGITDPLGPPALNARLRRERAERVSTELERLDWERLSFIADGELGSSLADPRPSVRFRVESP